MIDNLLGGGKIQMDLTITNLILNKFMKEKFGPEEKIQKAYNEKVMEILDKEPQKIAVELQGPLDKNPSRYILVIDPQTEKITGIYDLNIHKNLE